MKVFVESGGSGGGVEGQYEHACGRVSGHANAPIVPMRSLSDAELEKITNYFFFRVKRIDFATGEIRWVPKTPEPRVTRATSAKFPDAPSAKPFRSPVAGRSIGGGSLPLF